MTIQIGKGLVSRGPANQRMLVSALYDLQALSDASGRAMSLWEGRRRDPRRGYLVPCFTVVLGTAPPRGARLLADPRSGAQLELRVDIDDVERGTASCVVLAAIARPDLPKRVRRQQIRAAARERKRTRGR